MAERTIEDMGRDYQAARDDGDDDGMARFQNQEAGLVLLTVLERLASDPRSFIHEVAIKGGILMAGELKSPRTSADVGLTSGHLKRVNPQRVIREVREARPPVQPPRRRRSRADRRWRRDPPVVRVAH